MKKKILIILFLGLIILVIIGYGIKNGFNIYKQANTKIVENDISLSIKEGTLIKTGATIILKNNSTKEVSYGNPYEIQIKKANKWYKIDVDLYFNLPAYSLKPHEEKEIELNWKDSYGKLKKGKYRIIKNINYKNKNNQYDSFNISVEFIIK